MDHEVDPRTGGSGNCLRRAARWSAERAYTMKWVRWAGETTGAVEHGTTRGVLLGRPEWGSRAEVRYDGTTAARSDGSVSLLEISLRTRCRRPCPRRSSFRTA